MEAKRFYNPMTTLLAPEEIATGTVDQTRGAHTGGGADDDGKEGGAEAADQAAVQPGWIRMRNTGELRHAHAVPVPQKKDSWYTEVQRREKRFNPLKIPTKLQEALPFASKPKEAKKRANKSYLTKRYVTTSCNKYTCTFIHTKASSTCHNLIQSFNASNMLHAAL